MTDRYDVIVIGSGPGGEGAAMKAAKEGKRVAIIEAWPEVGGNCTHRATIPSKALRQGVQQLMDSGRQNGNRYPDLLKAARGVIEKQVSMRCGFYSRNHVDVVHGRGARVGSQQSGCHRQGRRLAGAVRADDAIERPVRHVETQVVDCGGAAEALRQTAELERMHPATLRPGADAEQSPDRGRARYEKAPHLARGCGAFVHPGT